jgi:alginate O-acetyltransferase complex protein AlgJ
MSVTPSELEGLPPRPMTSRALVALFVIGIAMPCLGTITSVSTGTTVGENRLAAPFPDFAAATPREMPLQIDAWFADHFGFRTPLVSLNSAVQYFVFGVSSSKQVVLGRDGWLFYAADRILASRRGALRFTIDQLVAWQARLEERRDWLARRGIRYLFVIAPEKSSLYAELLPEAPQPTGLTLTDEFVSWMRQHSTVPVLDVRSALLAVKDTDRLYHRTDSHWNEVGSFAAYGAIAAWLQTEFPAVQPLPRSQFDRTVWVTEGGDLAGVLGLVHFLSEERLQLTSRTHLRVEPRQPTALIEARASFTPQVFASANGEIGRAVIVHDSFFDALARPLTTHFRRSVLIQRVFPPEIILDERPDVVIEEMVERCFSRENFLPESELADWRADGEDAKPDAADRR